jgi:hypothetical protein
MRFGRGGSRVLWYESIGFLLIIGVLWLDHVQGLSEILFGGGQPQARDWRGSAMATLVVIFIGAIVWGLTKRLVDRLRYLDGFLRVCAWCRNVGHKGRWMRLEDWFSEGFSIRTSHGMCPQCLKKMQEETVEFRRKQLEAAKGSQAGLQPCPKPPSASAALSPAPSSPPDI